MTMASCMTLCITLAFAHRFAEVSSGHRASGGGGGGGGGPEPKGIKSSLLAIDEAGGAGDMLENQSWLLSPLTPLLIHHGFIPASQNATGERLFQNMPDFASLTVGVSSLIGYGQGALSVFMFQRQERSYITEQLGVKNLICASIVLGLFLGALAFCCSRLKRAAHKAETDVASPDQKEQQRGESAPQDQHTVVQCREESAPKEHHTVEQKREESAAQGQQTVEHQREESAPKKEENVEQQRKESASHPGDIGGASNEQPQRRKSRQRFPSMRVPAYT